jgi:hypothetical protein
MAKSSKGSAFEREISKRLSLWYTQNGEVSPDIFYRTSNSGGRATVNKRFMKGQHGDITAINPIGNALIDKVTIELKRGYKGCDMMSILDRPERNKPSIFEQFLDQAMRQRDDAKTPYFWLITKRDGRDILITVPTMFYVKELIGNITVLEQLDKRRIDFKYKGEPMTTIKFDTFLEIISPDIFLKGNVK